VAFLNQIGYRDPMADNKDVEIGHRDPLADLDDFLDLKATVRAGDLNDLTPEATPSAVMGESVSPMSSKKMERVGVARDLVSEFRDFKQRINKDRERLDTLGATLAADRADNVEYLGGTATRPGPAHGLTEGVDEFFTEAVSALNDPKADKDATWGVINARLSDKQVKQFKAFFEKHKVEPKKGEGDSGNS
jgi:hypothetical protein